MLEWDRATLTGQLLVAMPSMSDSRFEKAVIYVCAHNEEGAMGLVINKLIESLTFTELMEQLNLDTGSLGEEIRVHFGGPVEIGRGFVLHSSDYMQDASLPVNEDVALTATVDILKQIAGGGGPRRSLLALGYAGWGPGQLDSEIQENGWLTVDADEGLLFGEDLDVKWEKAIGKLGFDPSSLSGQAGRA